MSEIKPIILTDHDTETEYTLEFNREAIVFAEQRGFKLDDVVNYPLSKVPEFFYYAFRMHHRNISKAQTDKILEKMNGIPNGFIDRLVELYSVPFDSLGVLDEGEERKNSPIAVDF